LTLTPIGLVESPYRERFGVPRQGTLDGAGRGRIVLNPGANFEQALQGVAGFDMLWVIYGFHLNSGWNPMVTPTRGPKVKRGLFATRAPHRPNPIGLTAVKILGIQGRTIEVEGLDILDGSPVYDLKPYIPYADAFPAARSGWLDELPEGPTGPDRPS